MKKKPLGLFDEIYQEKLHEMGLLYHVYDATTCEWDKGELSCVVVQFICDICVELVLCRHQFVHWGCEPKRLRTTRLHNIPNTPSTSLQSSKKRTDPHANTHTRTHTHTHTHNSPRYRGVIQCIKMEDRGAC